MIINYYKVITLLFLLFIYNYLLFKGGSSIGSSVGSSIGSSVGSSTDHSLVRMDQNMINSQLNNICDLTDYSTIINIQSYYAKVTKNLNDTLLKYCKLFLLNKILHINNKTVLDLTWARWFVKFEVLDNELNTIKKESVLDFKNKLDEDYYKKKIFGGNKNKCNKIRLIQKYLITGKYYQKKF